MNVSPASPAELRSASLLPSEIGRIKPLKVEDKTRLIEFGHHAAVDRKKRGVSRTETVAFLGLTRFWSRWRVVARSSKDSSTGSEGVCRAMPLRPDGRARRGSARVGRGRRLQPPRC